MDFFFKFLKNLDQNGQKLAILLETPQFLQPFSIYSADFPCRGPAFSSPHSFYGQNICSVGNLFRAYLIIILKPLTTSKADCQLTPCLSPLDF